MVFLIAIAGGSGSGKSTLAYGLKDKYPDLIEVVHFDDYQKPRGEAPVYYGLDNWEHPEAIDFLKLLRDLNSLKEGKEVTIMTKSERYNPKYREVGRISLVLKPREIIILEGYMSLVNEKIRAMLDYSIFLDLHEDERLKRRTKLNKPGYIQKILVPKHKEHVEPTKKFAVFVIDVTQHSISEARSLVLSKFKEKGFL